MPSIRAVISAKPGEVVIEASGDEGLLTAESAIAVLQCLATAFVPLRPAATPVQRPNLDSYEADVIMRVAGACGFLPSALRSMVSGT